MPRDARLKQNIRRQRTIAQIGRLALNPDLVIKVMQASGDDPDALIKVLAQCPVLSGRVIGVANSVGSSAIHRMDTVDRCVRHLGAKQTRTIALTMALQLMVDQLDVDRDLIRGLWASAVMKAIGAQLVAETVDPGDTERAYSLGLLQDVGLPVLLAVDPWFFLNRLAGSSGDMPWVELERAHFGIDHAQLGAVMLESWNVPADLVEQVERHHDPLGHDDITWLAEMPSRVAGLLPHFDEQVTQEQSQMLAVAHARFLSGEFETLDRLLNQIKQRFKRLGKAAGGNSQMPKDFVSQLVHHVASDTFMLVEKVTRLDDQLAEAQEDALSDQLTGLLNRRGLETFGQQMLDQAIKANLPVACFVIDLDDFKQVNDTHGHVAGDRLLVAVAELLRTNVAKGDILARVGGDEFAIMVIGDPQTNAHGLAQRLHKVCNGNIITLGQGTETALGMSIGGVYLNRLSRKIAIEQLLDAADQMMYSIKREGKAGIRFERMPRKAA